MRSATPLWLVAAPVVFLVLWSAGYPVAKVALRHAEPMTMLALRFGIVFALMAVLFVILRPVVPQTKAAWLHLAFVGFLIQSVYFGLSYFAFYAGVAAGTVALIMSLQPILVALAAPRWSGEAVGLRTWIGLGLGLTGTAIVIAARLDIEPPSLFGFACAGLALLGITTGSLWEKRFGVTHHPVTANLVGFGVGLICIVPAMLALETMQVAWNWEFTWALAYLVIGNSVIAVGLLLAMIRSGDVSRVSALLFMVPPLAALLAWVLLDEVMPPLAWFGMAVAALGVWLVQLKRADSSRS